MLKKLPVSLAVDTQGIGRRLERSMKAQGIAILERVGQRDFRLNPLESVTVKIELSEKGGRKGQGLNGGADIVGEPGKCKLGRAGATAHGPHRFNQ